MRRFFDPIALGLITVWERLLAAWTRVGRIRAVYALAGLNVAILVLDLTFPDDRGDWLWAATLAVFAVYCFARGDGMRIFQLAFMPGCIAFFAGELLGALRWVGVALIPVALWMAWSEDQPPEQASGESPSLDPITSTT